LNGALGRWTVWVDGQKMGVVANGRSVTVDIAPGRHAIVIGLAGPFGTRSEPFVFDAEPGARLGLITKPSPMGRPRIWRSDAAPAKSGLTELLDRAAGSATLRRAMDRLSSSSGNAPVPTEPVAATPRPPMTIISKVIEGSRYAVPMGDETRTVDNSKSTSSTQRVVRLTREWSRTCVVDVEQATTARGSAGLGIHLLALKAEAERTLKKTYSASSEERETFEEEVTLNVSAHTRSEIVFSWKEIRQQGVVQLVGEDLEAQIPYEAVVGLTFDQRQIDA
jgi:hypothetical protein